MVADRLEHGAVVGHGREVGSFCKRPRAYALHLFADRERGDVALVERLIADAGDVRALDVHFHPCDEPGEHAVADLLDSRAEGDLGQFVVISDHISAERRDVLERQLRQSGHVRGRVLADGDVVADADHFDRLHRFVGKRTLLDRGHICDQVDGAVAAGIEFVDRDAALLAAQSQRFGPNDRTAIERTQPDACQVGERLGDGHAGRTVFGSLHIERMGSDRHKSRVDGQRTDGRAVECVRDGLQTVGQHDVARYRSVAECRVHALERVGQFERGEVDFVEGIGPDLGQALVEHHGQGLCLVVREVVERIVAYARHALIERQREVVRDQIRREQRVSVILAVRDPRLLFAGERQRLQLALGPSEEVERSDLACDSHGHIDDVVAEHVVSEFAHIGQGHFGDARTHERPIVDELQFGRRREVYRLEVCAAECVRPYLFERARQIDGRESRIFKCAVVDRDHAVGQRQRLELGQAEHARRDDRHPVLDRDVGQRLAVVEHRRAVLHARHNRHGSQTAAVERVVSDIFQSLGH